MFIEEKEYQKRGTYEVDRLIVDAKTHKVLEPVYENDELKLKTAKQKRSEEYFKYQKQIDDRDEFEEIIASECGSFYFNFFNKGLISMDIKESIKVRFLYLCTYANYMDKGMYLIYENGRKIDRDGIANILNLSETEFKRTMAAFIKSGLLIKECKNYIVNDEFAHRGKLTKTKLKQDYSRMFDSGLRNLYENCDAKQHKQLYYLVKLLPYVNKTCNVICQNPDETIPEDVIPLKLSEICSLVGYNPKNSGRFEKEILQLRLFDEYAMLGIKCGSGVWYKINPRLLYAGKSDDIDEFKKLLCVDFKINATF